MKKILLALVLLLIITGGALAAYHYNTMQRWLHSPYPDGKQEQTVTIPRGSSVRGALALLTRKGLVAPSPYVRFVCKIGDCVEGVQAGEYELSASQSPIELLTILHEGKIKTYSFTIPEGYTVNEIDGVLANLGYIKKGELIELKNDRVFLESLDLPYLEGYLFPSTYHIPKGKSAREIAAMMVDAFRKQITPEMTRQAERHGFDIREIVVIASIAEKEAGGPAEYPLVASVIHNRLKRGMRLQMDPTVIYGITQFNGNLTRRDLERDHPWNTYTRAGLPPTPICNPGAGALQAATDPAETNYLYFVSMNNGTHKFTSTLRDHNNAVQKYQIRGQVGP